MSGEAKKPTLAEMFEAAEGRVKPSKPPAEKTRKPEWDFRGRPTGGLKPDGFKVKAEIKF
jgi:hypothetical protein